MSALTDKREDAASALTDALAESGVAVYDTWPDGSIVPPAVIVIPGSPYVRHEDNNGFSDFTLRLRAVVVTPYSASASVQSTALDALLETALVALVNAGFQFEEIEQPGDMTVNSNRYLATFIRFSTEISL